MKNRTNASVKKHYEQGHVYTSRQTEEDAVFNSYEWSHYEVLEIGCGEGFLMEGMAEVVKEVHGVDISNVAIATARKFLEAQNNCFLYVNDNIECFADNSFDFIWEQTVFQHMVKDHVREYIEQSYRKLKMDRYVLFQFVWIPNLGEEEHDKDNEQNISRWKPKEFTIEMNQVGFVVIDVQKTMVSKTEVYYMVAKKE